MELGLGTPSTAIELGHALQRPYSHIFRLAKAFGFGGMMYVARSIPAGGSHFFSRFFYVQTTVIILLE